MGTEEAADLGSGSVASRSLTCNMADPLRRVVVVGASNPSIRDTVRTCAVVAECRCLARRIGILDNHRDCVTDLHGSREKAYRGALASSEKGIWRSLGSGNRCAVDPSIHPNDRGVPLHQY